MHFALDAEQDMFRKTVAAFLAEHSPEAEVRRLMATATGYEPAVWASFATDTCAVAADAPRSVGGGGLSFVETAVAMEEAGRVLFCAPLLSSVMATTAVLATRDDDPARSWLSQLASGQTVATVALLEPNAEDPSQWSTSAEPGPDQMDLLTGTKSYVFDGNSSEHLLVAARSGEDVGLYEVSPGAEGLRVTALPTLDQTRKQARVDLVATPGRRLALRGSGTATLARLLDLTRVAIAAEQVGGASAALALAVDYASTREQFGRPIGSFQAVKHACADVLYAVESARSVVHYAAYCADHRAAELPAMARLAKALASEAYLSAAGENLQLHGGIGFTWANSAHLHLKRAKSDSLLFGQADEHRQELGRMLGYTA